MLIVAKIQVKKKKASLSEMGSQIKKPFITDKQTQSKRTRRKKERKKGDVYALAQ